METVVVASDLFFALNPVSSFEQMNEPLISVHKLTFALHILFLI